MGVRPRIPDFALFAVALVLLAGCASSPIRPFTMDGCSRFPDGSRKHRALWKECCVRHDEAYWRGGTSSERRAADRGLKQCVDKVANPVLAQIMFIGVRAGGSPFWPTSYRWAYGWHYGRGYSALSEEEQQMADEMLAKAEPDELPPAAPCE